MVEEIVLIKPRLDSLEARKMENNLNGRFNRVATKFGKGLLKAFVGGGVVAAALTVINRLLNPLEAVEERIKSLLGQSDNISDTAEKFGTTAGKYFKLEQLGHAAGLDQAGLKEMLGKFQEKIKLAQKELADPNGDRHLSTEILGQYAGEKDIASAFYRAIQQLQTKNPEAQAQAFRAIFDQNATGGARKFLQSDFSALTKKLGLEDSSKLDAAFNNTAKISELSKTLEASRNVQNVLRDSDKLNPKMIQALDKALRAKDLKESEDLGNFETLKKASLAIQEIKDGIDNMNRVILKIASFFATSDDSLKGIAQSRAMKYFRGGF